MADFSKSSLNSPSGTNPTGSRVPGGRELGFHPQQMHQQFANRGKFPTPPGLHQQRPVMESYKQYSASQQQGPYAHQASYQQLSHQQQLHQHQQQHQQQHRHQQMQQLYQHQMQFTQQSDFLQHPMPFPQDAQKSSQNQSQKNFKSADEEIQDKESSVGPKKAADKPDNHSGGGSAEEASQTPAEKEKFAKELEAVKAAYEKQVKELEAQVKALQEQKSQKEVKYLRVRNSDLKKRQKQSQQSKDAGGKSTVDIQEEDMDTCEGLLEGDVYESCPSPALSDHSVVSIKEEPVDRNLLKTIEGVFPQESDEEDSKANINKEIAKSGTENKTPKPYTLSVTDFDFCIYCQTKSEMKMTHVTEDNLATLQSIVLNVDCEASTRLKDYILDYDLFLNNLPQFHSVCKDTALKKLQKIRKKNKSSEDTNFSLCIFCQEHSCETLNNFAEKGFASFKNDLSNLDEMMIDKLRKCLNFDRIKNIVEIESNKEEFSPVKLKYHKNCRHKTRIKNRPRKNLKTLTSEPEKREENVESTPDEDIFELLAMREKKNEELKQRKQRKELPEPNEFDYETKCVLCGTRESDKRGKFRTLLNNNIEKIREIASKNEHTDIIKILEHVVNSDIGLLCHYKCFANYNYNRDKIRKGIPEKYELALKAIVIEIEEPMFRNGKVFSLVELREKFLKKLMEFNIESDQKMHLFANRVKNYYTFNNKCRVNVIPYPDCFVYSNHFSELQVASQVNELKKEQVADDLAESTSSEIKKKWRFSCTECGYKCVKKSTLKKHSKKHEMRSIEEIVLSKQVMCELCGKMVKSKNSLKVHMQSHSGEKFPCSHCEKVYNSKYSLNDHARIHTGEKNKECPDCGKKFFGKKQLGNHIRRVHRTSDKQFLCSECGKSFKSKDLLKEHSNKHSGNRPFICKVCGKAFKFRGNLRTHRMAHDGKKPQMCSICNFGCYTKDNLKLHMAIHTGNKQIMFSSTELMNEESVSDENIQLGETPNIKAQTYFPLY